MIVVSQTDLLVESDSDVNQTLARSHRDVAERDESVA